MRANEPSQINQRDSGAQQLQSLLWGTTSATESAPGAGLPQPPVQWEAAVSASKAIEERTTRAVAALTEAIGYLQNNWLISPRATQSGSLPPDMNIVLARNSMRWEWNNFGGLWEPSLLKQNSPMIFQARLDYLDYIKDMGTPARQALVKAAICTLTVGNNPKSLQTRTEQEQEILKALTLEASKLLERQVDYTPKGVATLMRAHALYTFLKTEEDRLFPPSTDDDD